MQRDPLYGRVTGEIRWWLLAARAEEGLKGPVLVLSAWVNGGVVVQQGGTGPGGADEGEVGTLDWSEW